MKKTIIVLLIIFMIPFSVIAAGNAGSSSGEALLIYPEAALNASGNAGAGLLKPNWQFIQLNPAYLSIITTKTAGFSNNEYVESMRQNNISFINEYKNTRYLLGINYFDYGDFNRTTYSSSSINLGNFSAKSYVIKGYLNTPKLGNIYTGIGLKYFFEKLDSYSGKALAVDFGGLYVFKDYDAAIGLTIQNIGTQIKYQSKNEDLPLLIKFGGSYYMFDNKLGIFLDIEKIREQDSNFLFGAQYSFNPIFTVRAGIDGSNDANKGINLGMDINLNNGIDINYAFIPYNHFDASHKLTFAYNFGKLSAADDLKKEKTIESKNVKFANDLKPKVEFTKQEKITEFSHGKEEKSINASLKTDKISVEEGIKFIIKNLNNKAVEIEISNAENFDMHNILNYFIKTNEYSVKLDYGKYFWRYRSLSTTDNEISDWSESMQFTVFKTVNLNFDRNGTEIVIIEIYKSSDLKKPYFKQILADNTFNFEVDDSSVEYYYTLKGFDKEGKRILYESKKTFK